MICEHFKSHNKYAKGSQNELITDSALYSKRNKMTKLFTNDYSKALESYNNLCKDFCKICCQKIIYHDIDDIDNIDNIHDNDGNTFEVYCDKDGCSMHKRHIKCKNLEIIDQTSAVLPNQHCKTIPLKQVSTQNLKDDPRKHWLDTIEVCIYICQLCATI